MRENCQTTNTAVEAKAQMQKDVTVEQMKQYIKAVYNSQTEETRKKLDAYAAMLRDNQLAQEKAD